MADASTLAQGLVPHCRHCGIIVNQPPFFHAGAGLFCGHCDDLVGADIRRQREGAIAVLDTRERRLFDMHLPITSGQATSMLVSREDKWTEYRNKRIRAIDDSILHLQKSLSEIQMPVVPAQTIPMHLTSVLGPFEDTVGGRAAKNKKSMESELLVHWDVGTDDRASLYLRERNPGNNILRYLVKLARNYSWDHTTHMISSTVIERFHHDQAYNKRRYVATWDVQATHNTCEGFGWVRMRVEEISADELAKFDVTINKYGLIEGTDGYSHKEVGLCSRGQNCTNAFENKLPADANQVFTRKFRNVHACGPQRAHVSRVEGDLEGWWKGINE
ncbi:Uu.00g073810.m01.CDS01 [Anthostomella pinea]|uniref:Uu.00g073810.m01.CDS01 n=1 Tax=Anthostomella pinea TaxID=933095 RepID=A0AAI8VPQ7_9PEZI|nr:Uu.00g073810.m01.CDS01 [Anthostomella pinea]